MQRIAVSVRDETSSVRAVALVKRLPDYGYSQAVFRKVLQENMNFPSTDHMCLLSFEGVACMQATAREN